MPHDTPPGHLPPPTTPGDAAPPSGMTPAPEGSLREAMRRLLSPSMLSHLILVLFLLLLVGIVHWVSLGIGQTKSKRWLCQIDEGVYADCKTTATTATAGSPTPARAEAASAPPAAEGEPTPSPGSRSPGSQSPGSPPPEDECGQGKYKITPEQAARLAIQVAEVKRLAQFHGDVMAYFFSVYYLSIAMILFGGVIVAVALFFIAQNGWGPTNPYVKTIFVVMAAVTAYYGLFPPVFQQEKNISDNTALFLEYQTLRREIESYPQTCANVGGEQKAPPAFINYVNSELRRLGKIAIGFDYSKIDYKGAFDLGRERTRPQASDDDAQEGNPNTKGKGK